MGSKAVHDDRPETINSWRNRLIGDRELPGEHRLTRTNIEVLDRTLNKRQTKWELEPSGLLGPVTLSIDSTR